MSQAKSIGGILGIVALVGGLCGADTPRVPAGKGVSDSGSIIRRSAGTTKWEPVKKDAPIYTGDMNVGLPGSAILSANGAVRLDLLADLDGTSPFPIMESAVVLKANDKVDLDFVLDRGRIDLKNLKKDDKAVVLLHFHKENWKLTLEPNTEVAVELYGRWAPGVHCNLKLPPEKRECPTANLVIVVLKGELTLDHEDHVHAMRAPPGPALFLWDSVVEEDTGPRRLDKLPEWADPNAPLGELAKRKLATLRMYRERVEATSPEKAIEEGLVSGDYGYRRLATVVLGATDNVGRLIDILSDPKMPADAREAAILVLRHWIGRCGEQDPKLYDVLTKEKKFTPAHAELFLLGLHSMGEAELARPETYEALIHYLMSSQQAIRELAHWHLQRLVPLGKAIDYDATYTADKRQKAQDQWKKLIPEGQLPIREKIKQKLKEIGK